MVLPVPGGPAKRAPLGTLAPIALYFCGFFKKSTSSLTYILAFPSPAISLNKTFGLLPSAIWPKNLVWNIFPMELLYNKMGSIKGKMSLLSVLKNLLIIMSI